MSSLSLSSPHRLAAAADYKEALVLDPDNEGLKADIIKLEQQITAQQRQRADEELD